jgi:hypothetical protein
MTILAGMIKSLLLSILFLWGACSRKHDLVGNWKANKYSYSLWDKGLAYLKGSRALSLRKELDLFADSTFKVTAGDFGIVQKGTWKVIKDSLILISDSSWFDAYDSARVNRTLEEPPHHSRESFGIRGNKLIQYHSGNYCSQRRADGTLHMNERFIFEILKRQ